MKRKMIGAAAAYMAGLFFASFFTDPALLIVLSAMIAAALIIVRKYGARKGDYIVLGLFFAASVCAFSAYSAVRYYPVVAMDGKSGSFKGEVSDVVRYEGGSASYILSGRINDDISAKVSFYSSSCEADYGDIISIESCDFSKPSKDYFFDSERYYKSDGVFLSIGNAEGVKVEAKNSRSLKKLIVSYREDIIFDFRTELGKDSGDLLSGMVFGEKRSMDVNLKTAVYRSGIGHMLAVSGLHVSVAVFVLMTLLSMLRVNRYVSFAAMELILIFLTAMADYPVSAVRAAIMMNFMYASRLFRRQNDTFNSLAGAVLLICLFQPYVVYDEGFILSVAGTFGIGVFAQYMTKDMPKEKPLQKLIRSFAVMFCTTVCVFPFSVLFFDETSLISPLTNLIVVPLCSLSMVIGLVYAFTGGVFDLLPVSKVLNELVLEMSDRLAHIRWTHFSCDSKAIVALLLICTFMAVAAAALFRSRRFISICISLSLGAVFIGSGVHRIMKNSVLTVAVLGKGNNAAVVVCRDGCTDIIDLSGNYRSASYVRKYLMRNGISAAENAVLTAKVQSAFASYDKELEFTDIGKWFVFSDTDIAGASSKDMIYFYDKSVSIEHDDLHIRFDDGILTVGDKNGEIAFVKFSDIDSADSDITVCCGKAPKDADNSADNIIYLDDNNNFEIVLSEKGSCMIRRL
ncbi:ComEC/Rec2-related protein [Ruminococcus flavefaciens]|uniref:ComEC/Rec2-related protein n=1 Tax=Ruminococcus flavefaciens TaxID=1265 RepID=A0A1H6JPZ2_RUMFL|nr:ComEC/Rec2 family competence protein [Ruminococcus flavefaciens]SEH62644.1 ComEC/Rec2-related protein [Ruminococcus flavefaciens]